MVSILLTVNLSQRNFVGVLQPNFCRGPDDAHVIGAYVYEAAGVIIDN